MPLEIIYSVNTHVITLFNDLCNYNYVKCLKCVLVMLGNRCWYMFIVTTFFIQILDKPISSILTVTEVGSVAKI